MIVSIDLKCIKCNKKNNLNEVIILIRDLKDLRPRCRLCGNIKNECFEVENISIQGV